MGCGCSNLFNDYVYFQMTETNSTIQNQHKNSSKVLMTGKKKSSPCSPSGCYFCLWAGLGRRSSYGCHWARPSDWKFCDLARGWLYLASGREVAEIGQLWIIGFEPMPEGGKATYPAEQATGGSPADLFGRVMGRSTGNTPHCCWGNSPQPHESAIPG